MILINVRMDRNRLPTSVALQLSMGKKIVVDNQKHGWTALKI